VVVGVQGYVTATAPTWSSSFNASDPATLPPYYFRIKFPRSLLVPRPGGRTGCAEVDVSYAAERSQTFGQSLNAALAPGGSLYVQCRAGIDEVLGTPVTTLSFGTASVQVYAP